MLEVGNVLVIQSTHYIVFEIILRVIRAEMTGWNIDIVMKSENQENIDGIRKKIIYGSDEKYQKSDFMKVAGPKLDNHYHLIINTSNVPLGDYLDVYDDAHYPVGDFNISRDIIRSLDSDLKASLCVNMTYKEINRYKFIENLLLINFFSPKNVMKQIIRFLAGRFRPQLRAFWKMLGSDGPKIKKTLSDRIISHKDPYIS